MIKFGIIGTSKIAEQFILAASLSEDFKLSAVYSRTEERGNEFAEKYEIDNVFISLEEMAKSSCIDAVYIASPNSFHAQQATIFLEHNKHVLCEKPIASNIKELEQMINAAKNNNTLLMEAMKTTFLPNYKVIMENLNKLGKLRRGFFNYCQYSSRYDSFKAGKHINTFDPQFSNGSLMDIGVYCIHPAVMFFGIPKDIKSSACMLSSGVDGEGALILTYEDMDVVIMHSKIADSRIPCEIQGEKGSMIIDKINNTESVQIIYRNGEKEDLSVPQIKENMYYEVKEFIDLIKNNKLESELNSHEQSMKVLEIIEEARKQSGIIYPADNFNIR
jgi:predicted dehydrogenase